MENARTCMEARAQGREDTRWDFVAVLDQVIALLRQRGRVAYRTLKVQFQLDNEHLRRTSQTNSS